ncbi:nuclear transport factor 2 family protein [Mycobacterium marinum]|uniref:nuclear transport factor 2 family protein n=1 Tax=Mycobacterium marinum TaxID=1781 RepID=UPI003BEF0C27
MPSGVTVANRATGDWVNLTAGSNTSPTGPAYGPEWGRSVWPARYRCSMRAETQIANLLYRYAECIDAGDLPAAAALFEHARIRIAADGDQDGGQDTVDAAGLLKIWEALIIVYPNGTPRTKHVVSNPIIEIDPQCGIARCRSYYTVFQQVDDFPLQPIVTGRYHDRFACVDGKWRFSYRDLTLIDMVGDVSHHLRYALEPGPSTSANNRRSGP